LDDGSKKVPQECLYRPKNDLEEVVKSGIRGEITIKQVAKQIVNLTSDEPDDMLLLGVRNLAESIPKLKTNELIRKSNLSIAYVNSVLNPIFMTPDKYRLLVW
jgi:hypothetical protein